MSHAARPKHRKEHPVVVTLRVGPDVPNLRRANVRAALVEALQTVDRKGFRVIHYALEPKRLSFVVEADSRPALTTGCQGLSVRLARTLNRTLGRDGRFFSDRYEARSLAAPVEVARTFAALAGTGGFSSVGGAPLAMPRTALLAQPPRRAVGARR